MPSSPSICAPETPRRAVTLRPKGNSISSVMHHHSKIISNTPFTSQSLQNSSPYPLHRPDLLNTETQMSPVLDSGSHSSSVESPSSSLPPPQRPARRRALAPALLPLLMAAAAAALLLGAAAPGVQARAPPPVEHRVGGEDAQRAARRLAPRADSLHGPAASGWSTDGGDGVDGGGGNGGGEAPDLGSAASAPGCHSCTRSELQYCASADVIYDHCCCDMRYHEAFPFVPHTCYLRETPCTPLAGDCQNYDRLRTCCCDQLLRKRWSPSSSSVVLSGGVHVLMSLFLVLLLR